MIKREAPFEWRGIRPVDNGEMEEIVRADMRQAGVNMRKPKRLIFSTVLLTDDLYGPSVVVWSEKRSKSFHAQYQPKTEWVTMAEPGGSAA